MIKITRSAVPSVLDPTFVKAATAKFALDGSSVWDIPKLKEALIAMSHEKCAYCEVRLAVGPAYMEVEHFHAKKHHKGKVLDWNNLIPACKRCNVAKGDWDVAVPGQEMIDPTLMHPKGHFLFDEAYRPVGITTEGVNSVLEIDLDDIERLGRLRFLVGEKFKRKLEDLHDDYLSMNSSSTLRKRRSVIRRIKIALRKCSGDQPFSAVIATVLARSTIYASLKSTMTSNGEWDNECVLLDAIAKNAALI